MDNTGSNITPKLKVFLTYIWPLSIYRTHLPWSVCPCPSSRNWARHVSVLVKITVKKRVTSPFDFHTETKREPGPLQQYFHKHTDRHTQINMGTRRRVVSSQSENFAALPLRGKTDTRETLMEQNATNLCYIHIFFFFFVVFVHLYVKRKRQFNSQKIC